MIKEDYVSFEAAKLLKEKGFDITLCNTCYKYNGKFCNNRKSMSGVDNMICYPAPTLQIAMKWLRDVHNFHITAFPAWDNDDGTKMSFEKWGESIDGLDGEYCMPTSGPVYYNSYEEACEAAIKYVLENLI